MENNATWIETNAPARLDRLPWCGWHWYVVLSLGITWLLDGLEVTLAGSLVGVLKDPKALGMSDAEIGLSATGYLAGAVLGALVFGYLTDRLGRKRLFTITLLVYLSATAATALSWNFWSYTLFRFLTGAGIGGEYSAINSAIDELIPARVRGHVDLAINATFWIGAALGSGASIVLLNGHFLRPEMGWRFAYGIGAVLGTIVIFLRKYVPESPRWLITHGQKEEADRIVDEIERDVTTAHLPEASEKLRLRVRHSTPWREIWKAMAVEHRDRSLLGMSLMIAQSFFYNAVFFTYGLVLMNYFQVPGHRVGYYMLPLAAGNFAGPLVFGRLFDTIGRKKMIAGTYALSGILLAITSWLFREGDLTLTTQSLSWTVIFFIASCAASSAYLTVSEIFPLEIRGLAIAIFYAIGTLVGGVGAPALFGKLIQSGSRSALFWGYLLGAGLMIGAAAIEMILGVSAERQSLEKIAAPLSSRA
jgi:MFS family permease